MMARRRASPGRRVALAAPLALASALLLQACSSPPVVPANSGSAAWTGRLALRVDTDPPVRLAADFELRGRPESGRLVLEGPLGQTLLELSWSGAGTLARTAEGEFRHASLDEALVAFTGVALPVTALFGWLEGRPIGVDGWETELERLAEGRLLARRNAPLPTLELRLLLASRPAADNAPR